MKPGEMVSIFLRERGTNKIIEVPGVIVSEPMPSSYINRNTGATVQSQSIDVISRRDTRSQPNGRLWFQKTTEPVNLLGLRALPVPGLDVHEDGTRLQRAELFAKVNESIIEFKTRQAANQPAAVTEVEPWAETETQTVAMVTVDAEEQALLQAHRDAKAAASAEADQAATAKPKAKAAAEQTEAGLVAATA